jgi:hypothetical protein
LPSNRLPPLLSKPQLCAIRNNSIRPEPLNGPSQTHCIIPQPRSLTFRAGSSTSRSFAIISQLTQSIPWNHNISRLSPLRRLDYESSFTIMPRGHTISHAHSWIANRRNIARVSSSKPSRTI